MKISTKGRYGLRALVDIVANGNGKPVSLSSVAGRQHLSLNYLEQVMGTLRKTGIVTSVKGAGGGYRLAGNMDAISVKEVLEALEGKLSIVDSGEDDEQDVIQRALRECVWDEIDRQVNSYLAGISLGDLVREYRNKLRENACMYYI